MLCLLGLALEAGPSLAQEATPPATPPATSATLPPSGSVGGMGDINLYPKRVVIDARDRIATVGIYNKALSEGEYEITIGDKVMTPEGALVEPGKVTDPALLARLRGAAEFLRYSPRRVTLPASQAQTIRIMARPAPGLTPGEYRSHFTVVAVPPATEGLSIDTAVGKTASNSIGVRIVPRFGISIPVILRVGDTTLSAGFKDIALVDTPGGGKALRLTVTRSGTRSAFGDITVTAPGAKKPVAMLRGLGVYTELDARTVEVPIAADTDPQLLARGRHLAVTYTDDDAEPGKTLASQDFTVP